MHTTSSRYIIYVKIFITLFLSWLVPGFGVYYLRQKKWLPTIVMFLILLSLYSAGLYMADNSVSFTKEPYYFLCQIGAGSFTLLACLANSTSEPFFWHPESYYYGMLYTSVVGILNYILIVQVTENMLANISGENSGPT